MTPQQREQWVGSMGACTDWWALRPEVAIEPGWEIIDTHCHLWVERDLPDPADPSRQLRTSRYMTDEFSRDVAGHRLSRFIYVECGSGHYTSGPEHMRPVGETEFAVELARTFDGIGGRPRLSAMAAYADLAHPELDAILNGHASAGGGLVRAVRHSAARLEAPSARLLAGAARPGLYEDADFCRGVARLGERGLAFEAFQFHFQLKDLAELASRTPDTLFIINHLGAPIGYGRGAAAEDELFRDWAEGIELLAGYPNTIMKLGGIASPVTEYDAPLRDRPPSSEEFVEERGKYFRHAIAAFGAKRCMFESNFPVDSVSLSYTTLWNAYKIIAGEYRVAERQMLLAGTARKVYRLDQESAAVTSAASYTLHD
jgi:L-fuconolactonase